MQLALPVMYADSCGIMYTCFRIVMITRRSIQCSGSLLINSLKEVAGVPLQKT